MSEDDELARAQRRLLAEIANEAAETQSWTGRAAFSDRVMQAIARVPRHEFVPVPERPFAYENRPLAIGRGQTISQPYIVAVAGKAGGDAHVLSEGRTRQRHCHRNTCPCLAVGDCGSLTEPRCARKLATERGAP